MSQPVSSARDSMQGDLQGQVCSPGFTSFDASSYRVLHRGQNRFAQSFTNQILAILTRETSAQTRWRLDPASHAIVRNSQPFLYQTCVQKSACSTHMIMDCAACHFDDAVLSTLPEGSEHFSLGTLEALSSPGVENLLTSDMFFSLAMAFCCRFSVTRFLQAFYIPFLQIHTSFLQKKICATFLISHGCTQ